MDTIILSNIVGTQIHILIYSCNGPFIWRRAIVDMKMHRNYKSTGGGKTNFNGNKSTDEYEMFPAGFF